MNLWQQKKYYDIASEGSKDLDDPVMKELKGWISKSQKILDFGCGDGTRLGLLAKGKEAKGVDVSGYAIERASSRHPEFKFFKIKTEKVPFKDKTFDLVFSAFVLEHLNNSERFLKEAIRVLKTKGILFLAAPNYGAPSRRSPCSVENKYLKLVKNVVGDFLFSLRNDKALSWKKVNPRVGEPYEIDFDTKIEPYILSLKRFLENQKLKIVKISSCWEIKESNKTFLFKLIRKFGQKGIFPFKFWGPQLLVVAQKK